MSKFSIYNALSVAIYGGISGFSIFGKAFTSDFGLLEKGG